MAVMDVIEKEALCERANETGNRLKAGLLRLKADFPELVGDVRGLGAMVAMELISAGDSSRPNPELTREVTLKAGEMGLVLLSCGVRSNVIRILVPLTIKSKHLEEGLEILDAAFRACAGTD